MTALLKRTCYCASLSLSLSHLFNEAGSYTSRCLAPGAFPLSAQIYDDAAYITRVVAGIVLPLKSLPPCLALLSRSLVPLVAPAFGAGAPSEAHELFSRALPVGKYESCASRHRKCDC